MKWLLVTVILIAVVLGGVIGVFGAVVGRVPEYRVQVQNWLNERTGLVIEFRSLSARLRLFGPELVFDDAVVRTADRTRVLAAASRGSVGFDIWSSLRNWQLSAGRFSLDSPRISLIRTREGRIQLLGQTVAAEPTEAKPLEVEQLPTGRFSVTNALIDFRDQVTGRGPWSISGVSFDLTRDSDSIRLTGGASLPKTLGRELEFAATLQGGLQDPRAVLSTFSIAGTELDLSGWADVLPDAWPAPETGRGSLNVSASFHGPDLTQLTAKLDFKGISTALPMWAIALPRAAPMESIAIADELPEPNQQTVPDAAELPEPAEPAEIISPIQMVSYERVALTLLANRTAGQWHVSLSDLDLSRKDTPWRAERIEARWSIVSAAEQAQSEQSHSEQSYSEQSQEIAASADRVVLENLWPLLAYLPESKSLARLRALEARGAIQDVALTYSKDATQVKPSYSLQAQLQNVAFNPIERAPGLSGINGVLEADQAGGELDLRARAVRFELPRMFRNVLVAESLEGVLKWQVAEDGFTVRSDELRVSSEDGNATARAQVFVPRDGSSPVLDFSAQAHDLDVSATSKYVPGHRLQPKTLEWFDQAFLAGQVESATLQLTGPTRSFPFRNGEGTFFAKAQVEDATLNYHEQWLPATEIDAEVEFRNAGMTARASSAQFGKLTALNATGEIADFKENDLRIQAVVSGELGDALQIVKESPLGGALGPKFAGIRGEGPLTADITLYLPIKHLADRDVDILARLSNASVMHREIDAPVRGLTGSFRIRNTLVAAAELSGRWLNGATRLTIRPQNPTTSEVEAHGRAAAAPLSALLGLPPSVRISGASDWRVTTTLSSEDDALLPEGIHLNADLRDLGIELPAPIGKPEGEDRSLKVDVTVAAKEGILARASLGAVRGLTRWQPSSAGWKLDRGGLRADGVAPSLPSHRGLRIEGKLERFVLDDWLALKGHEGSGKPLSEYLQAANVRIGSFELYGYRWSNMRGILQSTASGWRVDVSGPDATGQVIIPESFTGSAPLRAAMEHLVLTKHKREREADDSAPTDPRKLPGLDVHVNDLRIGERSVGTIDITAQRVPAGLQVDRLTISGASMRAEARGKWLESSTGSHSTLRATVTSSDVAATLTALDYTPFLEAKKGEIKADLSWPGGFDDNILEQASGTIAVQAEAGQIVNLQPGAGRVLGLFSVAALPRRLALDFSDLTEKGLAFDTIHGDFDLREGNAYTSNLLLRGPAAEIGIAGRTGFGARDYDQTAIVTGNLGASLPVAGALAGGPAVGAALLLFSQVFKEPLKGMTRGYYRITGPWDNPNVERVQASDAKDATARVTGR